MNSHARTHGSNLAHAAVLSLLLIQSAAAPAFAAEEPAEHRTRVSTDLNGITTEMTLDSVRGSWTSYYQNISDVLNQGAELTVTPESVRRVMAVLDAATYSMETGETVKVERKVVT